MTVGYSVTPLLKKLGIKEEMKVQLIGQPEEYFNLLEKDISSLFCKGKDASNFIHLFVKKNKEFESEMKKIKQKMKHTTIIWVSWYKKVQELLQILQKM